MYGYEVRTLPKWLLGSLEGVTDVRVHLPFAFPPPSRVEQNLQETQDIWRPLTVGVRMFSLLFTWMLHLAVVCVPLCLKQTLG